MRQILTCTHPPDHRRTQSTGQNRPSHHLEMIEVGCSDLATQDLPSRYWHSLSPRRTHVSKSFRSQFGLGRGRSGKALFLSTKYQGALTQEHRDGHAGHHSAVLTWRSSTTRSPSPRGPAPCSRRSASQHHIWSIIIFGGCSWRKTINILKAYWVKLTKHTCFT